MSATPPPPSPPPPPHQPPQVPMPPYQPPMEGRSVSFFVALFLGLLLLISGGINVVLLLFGAIGGPSSLGEGSIEDDDAGYRVVKVGGDKAAEDRILRINVEGAISEAASPVMGAMGPSNNSRASLQVRTASSAV